jgi:serine/threonine-protein kinase RsbW
MAILRLSLSNQPSELSRVKFALGEFLEEEGVVPLTVNRVMHIVEELVVNVIRHAFDDTAKHTILLDVRTDARGVAIVVEDDGKPFDPRDASSPPLTELLEAGKAGGLGVTMIKKLARDLEYKRVDGRNHVRAFVEHGSSPSSA